MVINLPALSPHTASDVHFLGPDGVGVDRCRGKLGMPEPLLHQVGVIAEFVQKRTLRLTVL
jgi:hypothetical protein